jgi:perosamine synthetase
MRSIRVAEPLLIGNERKYVLDCLDSGWISSNGHYIAAFESAFAAYCGVGEAIAVSNGTAALHLALAGLGVGAGDEVIVPTFTYIATANAVRYCGAVPVLADALPGSMNIDPAHVERLITRRTRGIIAVHLYGQPADMRALTAIARRHGLFVIEDAAEAHGARIGEAGVGSLADCATFSFFGNKIITTGEGGMITTNDADLAARFRLLRGQGMDPSRRYWFPVVGFNYRMTNIQAALGLAQVERIDAALAARRQLAQWYDRELRPLSSSLAVPHEQEGTTHAFWMYTIWLREGSADRRDRTMTALEKAGIETRPAFHPLHTMPPYRDHRAFPVADVWAARGISLPTHERVSLDDVRYIAHHLASALAGADDRAPVGALVPVSNGANVRARRWQSSATPAPVTMRDTR